ncbi:MAG: SDR family NAD(P)-dependent oxidoreductase [Nitrososphaeraceae archaeon]|nr:SDR family NAD(P)-dependent oxidoreductase [Nitrososphaeraceae archaeon]
MKTYATMRNMSKTEELIKIASDENLQLNVAQLDVNDDLSVNKAIDRIVKDNDSIDVLVNNAGYDLFGRLRSQAWRR